LPNPIAGYWVVGGITFLVGIVAAGLTYPRTGVSLLGEVEEHGSRLGFTAGLLLVGIGQVIVLVAVIATGVRLGRRAHERE